MNHTKCLAVLLLFVSVVFCQFDEAPIKDLLRLREMVKSVRSSRVPFVKLRRDNVSSDLLPFLRRLISKKQNLIPLFASISTPVRSQEHAHRPGGAGSSSPFASDSYDDLADALMRYKYIDDDEASDDYLRQEHGHRPGGTGSSPPFASDSYDDLADALMRYTYIDDDDETSDDLTRPSRCDGIFPPVGCDVGDVDEETISSDFMPIIRRLFNRKPAQTPVIKEEPERHIHRPGGSSRSPPFAFATSSDQ